MIRIKFCGITSVAEARLVESLGGDAVGLLVGRTHAASDFITPEIAREICLMLPPFISSVVVTHLEKQEELIALAHQVPCTAIQLHSDLSGAELRELRTQLYPKKIIGKVSVSGVGSKDHAQVLARVREIENHVDAIVLDSIDLATDRVGGTGMTHDWSISAQIVSSAKVPIILAGGLNPENVASAIQQVKPWAVDVNSGVEENGQKSADRVRRFVTAVNSCK